MRRGRGILPSLTTERHSLSKISIFSVFFGVFQKIKNEKGRLTRHERPSQHLPHYYRRGVVEAEPSSNHPKPPCCTSANSLICTSSSHFPRQGVKTWWFALNLVRYALIKAWFKTILFLICSNIYARTCTRARARVYPTLKTR